MTIKQEADVPSAEAESPQPSALQERLMDMSMSPVVSLTPLPVTVADTLQSRTDYQTNIKSEVSESEEEPSRRRRSSRIQSKESRAIAETKIKEEKSKQEKEVS